MPINPLSSDKVSYRCDLKLFTFNTTEELAHLDNFLGQERAENAFELSVGIKRSGYNLFVMGKAGSGRHFLTRKFLEKMSSDTVTQSDWCYINNFKQSHKPLAIELPAKSGILFKKNMQNLIDTIISSLKDVFNTQEYLSNKKSIEEKYLQMNDQAYNQVQEYGKNHQVLIKQSANSVSIYPLDNNNKVISQSEIQNMSDKKKEEMNAQLRNMQLKLEKLSKDIQRWTVEREIEIKQLNHNIVKNIISPFTNQLRNIYIQYPKIIEYINNLEEDIITNYNDFSKKNGDQGFTIAGMAFPSLSTPPNFKKYKVNVLVSHDNGNDSSIVFENNPTYQNIIGRVEHIVQMGTLVTDFMLIKPGALHYANKGYLIIDAMKILQQPFAWDGLKRAIRTNEIKIESVQEMRSMTSTVTINPEPIPLDVKIILIGERMLYYLLYNIDPEFKDLFKVVADFEEDIERSDLNQELYARLIATIAHKNQLKPLSKEAVAKSIEQSARYAKDSKKLSINVQNITNILCEADYFAEKAGNKIISKENLQKAIDEQQYRLNRVQYQSYEYIKRGIKLITTTGGVVGQINALSVAQLGTMLFGIPSRITVTTRMGRGSVIDIEREVKLGGAIHSKGILIISGFLGARYAQEIPLSLAASIVFEQSYGQIDGDSASLAELCALLSSIANTPIKQNLAVTGSINQHGNVQAIGGVNEKIEGFFEICKQNELTRDQGVIIPASNIDNLMLKDEVVNAIQDQQFFIYPVTTLDEAIEILTGIEAGTADDTGTFPDNSINSMVMKKLKTFTKSIKGLGKKEE